MTSSAEENQLHRDIGRMEGRIAALEAQVYQTNKLVNEMHTTITSAKGSWKTLLMVAGFASAVTSGIFKLFPFLARS